MKSPTTADSTPMRICGWCGLFLSPGSLPASHGICPACNVRLSREMDAIEACQPKLPKAKHMKSLQHDSANAPCVNRLTAQPLRPTLNALSSPTHRSQTMRRVVRAVVVALGVITAGACKGPTAPSATPAPPADPTRPASIFLDFTAGVRTASVRAYVRNDAMAMLPDVAVTFSTNLGTLSTEKATTNDKGIAATTVNGEPGSAKVTATVGTLTGSTLVVLQSAPPPLPPDVPQPPPPPIPPPPPPPTPVAGYLVGLVAAPTPALIGAPVLFTATATPVNGAPLATSFAWTFGDGSPLLTTPIASTTYPYASAATFTVRVTATSGTASGNAFTTVTVAAAIPVVSVNCSTGVHVGSPTTCVASAALGGVDVPSSSITSVTWDFGDGPPPVIFPGNVSPPHTYITSATFRVFATATVTGATGPGTGSGTTTILP